MRQVLLTALLLAGVPALRAESVDLTDAEFIARGSASYAKSCAVGYCHGSEGAAGRGPKLRDRAWRPRELFRATHDGLPGTSMPAWKGILPEEEIWAITAYVVSLGTNPQAETVFELGAAPANEPRALSETAKKGHELFFDLTNQTRCAVCHQVGAEGSANIGPNLAQSTGGKPADRLRREIEKPQRSVAFGFEKTELRLRGGQTVSGILRDRKDGIVRVYDFGALPPVLRTFYGRQVRRVRSRKGSVMPPGRALGYTADEIDAIVAYLSERAAAR